MTPSPPEMRQELTFPHVTVVSASAGSGKTYALTRRYLRFILSDRIPNHSPKHLLAVTFTNNAAAEMKRRILHDLKSLALGESGLVSEISNLTGVAERDIPLRASEVLDDILDNFSEFQVRTIDAFLTNVFKVSAIELGQSPSVEIRLSSSSILQAAIREFSARAATDPTLLELLRSIGILAVDSRADQTSYLWNPMDTIARRVLRLSEEIASVSRDVRIPDLDAVRAGQFSAVQTTAANLKKSILDSGLPANHHTMKDIDAVLRGDFANAISHSIKTKATNKPSAAQRSLEESDGPRIAALLEEFNHGLGDLALTEARLYYRPYAAMLKLLGDEIERTKQRENVVLLEDVTKSLRGYIVQHIVPELYLRLGDQVFHFLIDEFQDTAPAQWEAMYPLLENTLAGDGSLFVVGDTKQSIYSFRGADWRIMKRLMEGELFRSAPAEVQSLSTNYRSRPEIVRTAEEVFQKRVAGTPFETAAQATGLSTYSARAKEDRKAKGHVEVMHIGRDNETRPELASVVSLLSEARARGWRWQDIAVLTRSNRMVVDISSALNAAGIPFLSQSSLDIRNRRVIGEVLALLRFLDTPVDDTAFAAFIMSDIMSRAEPVPDQSKIREWIVRRSLDGRSVPLFAGYQREFPGPWSRLLAPLYARVGFLPVYDLVSSVLGAFSMFDNFPEEQASLVQLLECAREFESTGSNSIRDFLQESTDGSEGLSWELPRQTGGNAAGLMTIHKAKGLGFPVVIVVLTEWRKGASGPALLETEDGSGVELLRVGDAAERNEVLKRLADEADLRYRADELNRLYVALTRAAEEMYIIVVSQKDDKPPASLLPPTNDAGPRPRVTRPEGEARPAVPIHFARRERSEVEVQRKRIRDVESRRGTFIHSILQNIEFFADLDDILEKAMAQTPFEDADFSRAEVRTSVRTFLASPEVAELFKEQPERRVMRELAVADENGRLYRIDRLILDPHRLVVVDFKTGRRDAEEAYHEQVRTYTRLCAKLYPGRNVEGLLAFVDECALTFIP